jgi:hypothetical protein
MERTNEGKEVSLDEIVKAFPHTKAIWSKEPPDFNPQWAANPVAAYRYVVVHVRGAEATGQFTKDGYWLLEGIAPSEFKRKLVISTTAP